MAVNVAGIAAADVTMTWDAAACGGAGGIWTPNAAMVAMGAMMEMMEMGGMRDYTELKNSLDFE